MAHWNITWERAKTKDISGITPIAANLYAWDVPTMSIKVYTTTATPTTSDILYNVNGEVLTTMSISSISGSTMVISYSTVH